MEYFRIKEISSSGDLVKKWKSPSQDIHGWLLSARDIRKQPCSNDSLLSVILEEPTAGPTKHNRTAAAGGEDQEIPECLNWE